MTFPSFNRISEREKVHKKEREDLLAEQARLEQQAVRLLIFYRKVCNLCGIIHRPPQAEYAQHLKQLEAERHEGKLAFRVQLEKHLEEKKALEEQSRRQKEVEDEEDRLYAEGKKKMTQMRKCKEAELLHELQRTQEKMATQLEQQVTQKSNDEDERIAKMVAEQDAKKEVSLRSGMGRRGGEEEGEEEGEEGSERRGRKRGRRGRKRRRESSAGVGMGREKH